jgi:benzoyl-CoA reductase subunit A
MLREYGKWPESAWTNDKADLRAAKKITGGADIGTTSTQVVILADGALCGFANIRTGYDFKAAADKAFTLALGNSGLKASDFSGIFATGFGRRNAAYATGTTDEVLAHAKGARFLYGKDVNTVVDLGGQTVKAVRLYDWDRVQEFKISDKCATGFGRHIETLCDLLEVPITEIGEKSLQVKADPEPVSTTCYNFAFPETVGLFRQGYKEEVYSENDVLATHMFTIAWRVLGTVGKLCPLDIGDISVYRELGFTGGLAKNLGVTKRIERELGVTALTSKYDPALAGAVGAALSV